MPGISSRHIVTNLLVCRLKRGIEVDRTARLLLTLLRPKLVNMANDIAKSGNDFETALSDLESATMEQLLEHYVMGEIGYPLRYLFAVPGGVINRFANNYAAKARKAQEVLKQNGGYNRSQDPTDAEHSVESSMVDDYIEHQSMVDLADRVNAIIDDGITFRTSEYRVLRFCLDNLSDSKRPLSGNHVFLAHQTGVVRSRVSRIYGDAIKKLAGIIGHAEWARAKNR